MDTDLNQRLDRPSATPDDLAEAERLLLHLKPGFPRWRCVFLTVAVKYDIKINAVLTI